MLHQILILKRVQKELATLPVTSYSRVKASIHKLAFDPRPRGSRKLTGREGMRIRSGEYRIIYEVDDAQKTVTILHIGHRRDIYHK